MNNGAPMFACASMHGSFAGLYFVVGCWLICFVLAFVNLVLTSTLKTTRQFKVKSFGILFFYVALGV
jgi:hypothetical protein